MEGVHRLTRKVDPKLESEFDEVQKMVSASAALAWRYLWVGLRAYHYRTVRVTPTAVADKQNKHSKSGERALDALKDAGLIYVVDKPNQGVSGKPWIVYVYHPSEVAEVRLATAGDGQPDLPIMMEVMDEEETPELLVGMDGESALSLADARPRSPERSDVEPPIQFAFLSTKPRTERRENSPRPNGQFAVLATKTRTADIDTGSRSLKTLDTLDKDTLKGVHVEALQAVRGSGDKNANSGPQRLAELLGGVLGGCSPAERIRRIDELDGWIVTSFEQTLGECDISDEPRRRVATAVVDGVYPVDQLQRVVHYTLKRAQAGKIRGSVGGYFVGAAKQSMREHDLRER